MGRKTRNIIRVANMKNFSGYTIDRYIMVEDDRSNEEKDQFVKSINERLWCCIQEVNVRAKGIILPYVNVRRVYKDGNNQIRIVINNIESETTFNELTDNVININELSHLINFRTTSPQRKIMVSDAAIPGNAKMIIDKEDQLSAAVDIFLDIAMFNAYSFFRNLSHQEKIWFSSIKYEYFTQLGENSYYLFSESEPPSYYSFAFSARIDGNNLDYAKYIELWENFINVKYSSCVNDVLSTVNQLKYHKDVGNLDKEYFEPEYWTNYKGDYLLLRINKEPHKIVEKNKILNYFGLTEFSVGKTKLVTINEYFNPYIRKLINDLIISAYKVVV